MPTENRSNDAAGWIACDDGLHLIQMDKNLSHYGWVFRKVDGGLPYSVREATSHEMAHAQARQHLRIGVAQIAGQAPAPQPHPEPIAWMVGTAIWWTKEEAERDAAATGLPMIPFGPLTSAVEQYPGEPVVLPACKAKLSMGHDWDQGYADGWRACLDEIAKLGPLYTHADPGEVERQRSRADTNALNHKHAKNALGDIKALVGRLVAGSNGQASIATGYLADIADFIDRRTIGDPVHIGDANALRLELQESRRNEFNACAQLAERDALLRDKSGDLIRMAAHLISAPLFALQDLQDEDKKMTRARVDAAVDSADARLKDAAYELRRIADALSVSAEPRVKS